MNENNKSTEKLPAKKTVQKRTKKTPGTAPRKLKLLFTIVNRSKAEFYVDLLQNFDINLQVTLYGNGTANTETLRYLGLTDTEKAVIISVIQENKVKEALSLLEDKFNTIKNGKGIAYTVPMTGTVGVAIYQFLSNNRMTVKEESK